MFTATCIFQAQGIYHSTLCTQCMHVHTCICTCTCTYLRTGLDAPDPCVVGGPHPVYARLIYIPAASHLTYDMYSDKSIIFYCRKNLHNAVALRKDNRIPLPTEKQGQRARTNLWESQNQRFGFLWPFDRTTCHFSLSRNRLCAYAFGYAWVCV